MTTEHLSDYWDAVYNSFDPFGGPIPPDKLKAWFVQRQDSPLEPVLLHFRPTRLPQCLILIGHSGSGKSTELTQLTNELVAQYDYFAIWVDLQRNVDNIENIGQIEALFLIGAAIYKIAEKSGLKPDKQRFDQLVIALQTIVQEHTNSKSFSVNVADLLRGLVCFGAGAITGAIGAGIVGATSDAFLKDFNFKTVGGSSLTRQLEIKPRLDEMLNRVNAIIEDAEAKANKHLILLVDGLDRINKEDTAVALFAENRVLADLRGRILYTAPPYMQYQPQFLPVLRTFQTTRFPTVRLRHRAEPDKSHERRRDEDGYAVLRRVVHQRLESVGLAPSKIILPKALDDLISASGGLMRELVYFVRDASIQADIAGERLIDEAIANQAIDKRRRDYQAALTDKFEEVLNQVRATHKRVDGPECDLLLKNNLVLSYSNKDLWYDAHSILDPLLR